MTAESEYAGRREEIGLVEQAVPEAGRGVRAVVVYRYPVYRDLIIRVLEKAEVEVTGALGVSELTIASLLDLHPDVIVLYDPDANYLLRDVAVPAFADTAAPIRRVVCVGSDNEMVVLHRLVIPDPSVEGLVGCVKGLCGEASALAWLGVDQVGQPAGLTEERAAGNGGS